jgi:putative toxin-antitoxin system antitoxin component (TIGR02293 family)
MEPYLFHLKHGEGLIMAIAKEWVPTEGGSSEAALIARFMGLPRWNEIDDLLLVDHVAKGLPAGTAERVMRRIDPEQRFLKADDVIPRTTLHRRKGGSLTKDESEKILALARVFAETLRLYNNDAVSAGHFLMRNHPMTGNRPPLALALASIAGADLVLKILAQADAGVAV